ncbi:hypothetical protein ONZ45_g15754 [Pleurotus djamor]|nr:hypothetical protein ONZ45_g15754 [Pleurotus djamor]
MPRHYLPFSHRLVQLAPSPSPPDSDPWCPAALVFVFVTDRVLPRPPILDRRSTWTSGTRSTPTARGSASSTSPQAGLSIQRIACAVALALGVRISIPASLLDENSCQSGPMVHHILPTPSCIPDQQYPMLLLDSARLCPTTRSLFGDWDCRRTAPASSPSSAPYTWSLSPRGLSYAADCILDMFTLSRVHDEQTFHIAVSIYTAMWEG